MRSILSWLLIIGVFAGLGFRAFSFGLDHSQNCKTECRASDHPPGEEPCSDTHDHKDEGPTGPHHHHHGVCVHVSPMVVDSIGSLRVPMPDGRLVGLQVAQFPAPDGPFFELDKPPLI